jgi:hypothetical protein
LTDSGAALATLALTTARALDEVVAGSEKRYVVAQICRAHREVLEALEHLERPYEPDAFDAFIAALSTPTRPESSETFDE